MHHEGITSERRRFNRILFDAPVTLATPRVHYTSRLIDISLKGALTQRPEDWKTHKEELLTLTILLDGLNTKIQMQAHPAHEEQGHIGFLCEQIDMQSISHLRRLVELNLGDSALLERELAALG